MITQDAFTRGSNLFTTILQKIPFHKGNRQLVICEILTLFLSLRGSANFSQLGRQGQRCEKTSRLHFEKGFDWAELNKNLILDLCSEELIIGFDPSYISKSGKDIFILVLQERLKRIRNRKYSKYRCKSKYSLSL